MKFINVTDKNFEDIFLVSAKYEQWQYVKHHIFDMLPLLIRSIFQSPFWCMKMII